MTGLQQQSLSEKRTDKETEKETDKRTDKRTDKGTDKETDKGTDKDVLDINLALMKKQEIICTREPLTRFPPAFDKDYVVAGVGLVICLRGSYTCSVNSRELEAHAGQTLFVPEEDCLQILAQSDDLLVHLLFYRVDSIRDILSNEVSSMRFYSIFSAEPNYIWQTDEEEDLMRYTSLLSGLKEEKETADGKGHADYFSHYERQLLLLALTHRLCSIYYRRMLDNPHQSMEHKHEIFVRLIRLIDAHYTRERGVEFYADKLCLSPKYLSALSKSICGYTVQELVFKSIVRKSISLLKNTSMNIQEIADYFNFPNASYYGTFFRKQTGYSPQHYREL